MSFIWIGVFYFRGRRGGQVATARGSLTERSWVRIRPQPKEPFKETCCPKQFLKLGHLEKLLG